MFLRFLKIYYLGPRATIVPAKYGTSSLASPILHYQTQIYQQSIALMHKRVSAAASV